MADITSTLNSWSSTSSSNLPANSASVGPNTLADNQRTIQAVVRAALAGDGTIASATTTDLSTVNDGDITVTGTTTITGLGTLTAGVKKVLTFSGSLILTHNATSLILPGAANITTAAGDVAVMRSLGSGNWKCIAFQPAAGNSKSGANADITSMTALTAPTVAANPIRATDLQAQLVTAFATGGTGTAFTLTPSPPITAYAANQEWDVSFSAACGAAPTFQVSGIAAPPNLVKQNTNGTYSNLSANDFPSGWQSKVKMVSTTQALVRSLPYLSKPAFSVYKTANQTGIVNNTYTLVTWDAEEFDTNNNFALNRFTPTVAGNYLLNAHLLWVTGVDQSAYLINIYKNGSLYKTTRDSFSGTAVTTNAPANQITEIVQANGTTDYFEIYVLHNAGSNQSLNGDNVNSVFSGVLV